MRQVLISGTSNSCYPGGARVTYETNRPVNIAALYLQARRQDFAVGGAKNHNGVAFFNTILDVRMQQPGAKHEMGSTDFK